MREAVGAGAAAAVVQSVVLNGPPRIPVTPFRVSADVSHGARDVVHRPEAAALASSARTGLGSSNYGRGVRNGRRTIAIVGILAVLLVLAAIAQPYLRNRQLQDQPQDLTRMATATVIVGEHRFDVAVARTAEERERGLSGVTTVPEDGGMLFTHDPPQLAAIWMLGMNIPIDIVWIADGVVVHVVEAAQPEAIPHTTYAPPTPASQVLEVAAGTAERIGLHVGTELLVRCIRAPRVAREYIESEGGGGGGVAAVRASGPRLPCRSGRARPRVGPRTR